MEEYDLLCSGRLWFSSSQEDILRRQKRFQFRFFFSSEETKSHALFHDCTAIAKAQNYVSLFVKMALNFNIN